MAEAPVGGLLTGISVSHNNMEQRANTWRMGCPALRATPNAAGGQPLSLHCPGRRRRPYRARRRPPDGKGLDYRSLTRASAPRRQAPSIAAIDARGGFAMVE